MARRVKYLENLVSTIDIIKRVLLSQVGDGRKIDLSKDSWTKGDGMKRIFLNLVVALKYKGISLLFEVVNPRENEMSLRPWRSSISLGLSRNLAWEWSQSVLSLTHNGIRLSRYPHKLVWGMNKLWDCDNEIGL